MLMTRRSVGGAVIGAIGKAGVSSPLNIVDNAASETSAAGVFHAVLPPSVNPTVSVQTVNTVENIFDLPQRRGRGSTVCLQVDHPVRLVAKNGTVGFEK